MYLIPAGVIDVRPDKVRSAAAIPHSLHMVVKQPMDSERVEVCVCMNDDLLRDAIVADKQPFDLETCMLFPVPV